MQHVDITGMYDSGRVPVFGRLSFVTPWRHFELITLESGACLEDSGSDQLGYIVLTGQVEFQARTEDGEVHARLHRTPAWLLAATGTPHRIQAAAGARLLRLGVEAAGRCIGLLAGTFDRDRLAWRDAIHGGAGRLATRHVLRPEQFASTWTFLDHAVLGPDSSLGYHYHQALEEVFVVLGGEGSMTVDDLTFAVKTGSITYQPPGSAHGLYNPGPQELELVRIAVAMPDQEYTTVDLNDDLRRRQAAAGP